MKFGWATACAGPKSGKNDSGVLKLVGAFVNRGRRWQPLGDPEPVNVHDFPGQGIGKAIPYGTYDVSRDEAVVNVGITHETAEFAVESIRRWWYLLGRKAYPKARRLLICADAGRQQRFAPARLESPPAGSCRSARDGHMGLPLPARHASYAITKIPARQRWWR